MLQFLARVITESVSASFKSKQFVGHIGGDDFVVITDSYDVKAACDLILSTFSKGINDFYSSEHVKNKYITAKNRFGQEEQYSLVTLSIACISNKNRTFNDIYELSEHASMMKKKCKQIWNNCCLFD